MAVPSLGFRDGGTSPPRRVGFSPPPETSAAAAISLLVLGGSLGARVFSDVVPAALARLSPELREAVILRDLEDMDYKEIAAVLHIPEGTVKSRISRGRGELARMLQRTEEQAH